MTTTTGKTALVLAGGGLTGAVYEIGALRAVDDLLVDRTVNDFDVYVGTSAGALVCAALANGISPEAMLQAFDDTHPEIESIRRRDLFSLDAAGLLRHSLSLPRTLWSAASHYVRHVEDMNLFDLAWTLAETLPSGMYDSLALERYVRGVLAGMGHSNRFEDLAGELYIIATHLDSGDRAVFGPGTPGGVPISLAVAASAAVPLLYQPVRIGDGEYVDGGLRGTASLDLAIERGAGLVVCINPLVPYDACPPDRVTPRGSTPGHLSGSGIQAVASQVTRISVHSGLAYHVKQLRRQHPEVDIILIEPRADDYEMFYQNIMRYSTRLALARHGFESVTLSLAADYGHYKQVLARHGIPLTRRLVIAELAEIEASGHDPTAMARVLQARPATCRRGRRGSPACRLTRSLAELDLALDNLAAGRALASPSESVALDGTS